VVFPGPWTPFTIGDGRYTHTLGLKVYEGELYYDVDTPADLFHLKKELAANPEAALQTAKFLRSL
jgi:hypothetical protein